VHEGYKRAIVGKKNMCGGVLEDPLGLKSGLKENQYYDVTFYYGCAHMR
jgi:hypothetical protein